MARKCWHCHHIVSRLDINSPSPPPSRTFSSTLPPNACLKNRGYQPGLTLTKHSLLPKHLHVRRHVHHATSHVYFYQHVTYRTITFSIVTLSEPSNLSFVHNPMPHCVRIQSLTTLSTIYKY